MKSKYYTKFLIKLKTERASAPPTFVVRKTKLNLVEALHKEWINTEGERKLPKIFYEGT